MKLKRSIRIALYITAITVLLTALIATGIWADNEAKQQECRGISVVIENADSSSFITKENIMRELNNLGIHPEGRRFSQINTLDIERQLNKIDFLENAECVVVNNSRLEIRVAQIVPVMRVFDGNSSYYVNGSGKRIVANSLFHNDVPVVSGHFDANYSPARLIPLARYVESSAELRKFVSMINVVDSNNVFIVPSIMGHVINIGRPEAFDNKFAKLKEFYTKVMPDKGWMYYDTISVKYNHQVVATRRVKAVKTVVDWRELSDEEADDEQTMTMSDTSRVKGSAAEVKPVAAEPKPQTKPQASPRPAAAAKPADKPAKSQADSKVTKAIKTN